jgi:hypothetical protein
MVKIAADHHHVTFLDREDSILDLPGGPAHGNTKEFEVVMTIHANVSGAAQGEEAHVNGEGGLKRVDVYTLGINLRIDDPRPIFPPYRGPRHDFHPLSGDIRW